MAAFWGFVTCIVCLVIFLLGFVGGYATRDYSLNKEKKPVNYTPKYTCRPVGSYYYKSNGEPVPITPIKKPAHNPNRTGIEEIGEGALYAEEFGEYPTYTYMYDQKDGRCTDKDGDDVNIGEIFRKDNLHLITMKYTTADALYYFDHDRKAYYEILITNHKEETPDATEAGND